MRVIDHKISRYLTIAQEIIKKQQEEIIVRGITVQKGKARGLVRIVKTYHDIKRVKVGDILVANTTHPNYLPAMHKAAAFVTNEGGVISPAAIVARELKKPCIVSTKIATQVLKDDTFVEVDATKGIIRIIKRK